MTEDSSGGILSVTESAGLSGLEDVARDLGALLDHGDYPVLALQEARELVAVSERALILAVRQARASGVTWRAISHHLGVSPAAAHLRFSKLI